MYEQQIKTITLSKRLMIHLIEQASLAYDHCEEWGEKLEALRIRAHNDCLLHLADMQELIRQLDHRTSPLRYSKRERSKTNTEGSREERASEESTRKGSSRLSKRLMIHLIEQASLAYDHCEEWGEKLEALRIRAHNDCLLHLADMQELIRQLDHRTSPLRYSKRERSKTNTEGSREERASEESTRKGSSRARSLSVKGQRRILKDLEKKEHQKNQRARDLLEQEALHYVQGSFNENTREDISKLAAQFIKQKEENFALFNYVNELNYKLEALSDNIVKLHENIDHHKEIKLEALSDNIVKLHENIDHHKEISEKRAKEQRDTIDSLKIELLGVQQEEQRIPSIP
ncbi:hypothetical protein QE152_g25356 [Popillia japonica]|uniref:ODAD1 central coiled coil region domain-containing protein n=1 Tax=Popillia japonica TaxID=7064 RepID=A0AAW1K313_POPJA